LPGDVEKKRTGPPPSGQQKKGEAGHKGGSSEGEKMARR